MRSKWFWIWTILALLMAAIIFMFSSAPADESGATSMVLVELILRVVPINEELLHFLVRKTAHFVVFFLLGFTVFNSLKYAVKNKQAALWLSWGAASAYGVLDEVHQIFVPGRAFTLLDITINAAGALAGAALAGLLLKKGNPKNLDTDKP